MSCTFAALLACFHLSGFYIDGAVIHSNSGEGRLVERAASIQDDRFIFVNAGQPVTFYYTDHVLDSSTQNPYMRIALGYDVQWSEKWSTRFDYSHESSIATGSDHGVERFTLGVTWRPFGR